MLSRLCILFFCLCVAGEDAETGHPRGFSVAGEDAETGHPRGFMSECPGSTKPATIPRSQLKHLHFILQGAGQKIRYNYWSARNIADDPLFNSSRKTVVICLGYLDSPNFVIGAFLASEYYAMGYNIIVVDYNRFSTVHYHLASRLMRPVGRRVAEVLAELTTSGLNPSTLELLGFSLGGQTVGFVARHYQYLTGRNVSKITALEPSGPCFRFLGPEDRLDASNADFVEVVHTNIDGFGMAQPMGHVDFYVNGGEYQPSDLRFFACATTCSHFRVLFIWQAALAHPKKFIGIKCNSVQQARNAECYDNVPLEYNFLGSDVNINKQGIFYLSTDKAYPFYLGAKGLRRSYVYWKRITNINSGNNTEIYT